MVTRPLSAAARPSKSAAGGSGTLLALMSVLAWGALASSACEKVPLMAPTGTVITLVASTNVLPINGSTDLTAVLIENGTTGSDSTTTTSAGTPVHNGTLVSFTTSLGRIEPAEARTANGKVTVKLLADGRSGVATVTAFSGSASEVLEVVIGAAATETVTISASPASVPANGGTAVISAQVTDASGNPLVGVPVSFTTSGGTLTPSSAVTDQNGQAAVTLTTTTRATVVASAGGRTAQTTVDLRSRSSISLTSPGSSIFVGAPASFTVNPGTAVAFSDVTIDFGDGQARSLGAISSSTPVIHFYESSGVFPVTVLGIDVDGGVAPASGSVAVVTWPFSASSSPTSGPMTTIFAFSVSGLPTTVPIDHIHWNFGDETETDTASTSTTHSYASGGIKTVTVTVFPLYGDPRSATFVVRVTTTAPD